MPDYPGKTSSLEQRLTTALQSWPQWMPGLACPPQVVEPIGIGRTNHSWLVDTSCGKAVLRLNSPHGMQLGIDRQREAIIMAAVTAAGIAPGLWYRDLSLGIQVTEYVQGRLWQADDFQQPRQQERLAEVIARYASTALALPRFDYLAHIDHYRQQLQCAGMLLPQELEAEFCAHKGDIRRWQQGWQPTLTHHDLIGENILDSDDRLIILDWEYAALGCSDFDVAAINGDRVEIDPLVAIVARLMEGYWSQLRQYLEG